MMRRRFAEWLIYDSRVARSLLGAVLWAGGFLLLYTRRHRLGADLLARCHRAALLPAADRATEAVFRSALLGEGGKPAARVRQAIDDHPAQVPIAANIARFFEVPEKLLRGAMIVLKSPRANERGVLYLYYSYIYPLLPRLFDVTEIGRRYRLVLEPSWSGYCDLNILCLLNVQRPIVVGSIEPRDTQTLRAISSDLVPVDIAGNTWVNPDVFKPLPGVEKDFDLVMIAGWTTYKRHWAFFRALSSMMRAGLRPRVALVGYPLEFSTVELRRQAEAYGVWDCLELFEGLQPDQVNVVLNRSKVNVLWSRREGVNRAIIEGMLANVPCVVRRGFNYGHHYHYINDATGSFADEDTLPSVLEHMIRTYDSFSPRERVVGYMTPLASTARLNDTLRSVALAAGETWTTDIAVKVGNLDGLHYLDPNERSCYAADYTFLESQILRRQS
jgi:glycosyltransferase involved in cell wall biosynthesis